MNRILFFCAAFLSIEMSFAAPTPLQVPVKSALYKKTNAYRADGVVIGGQAGNQSSLLRIRRAFFKNEKVERVVLDLGDQFGKPNAKSMAYFHVQNDPALNRIVIDLAQIKLTKVNATNLISTFQKSPNVKIATFLQDPEDSTLTLILTLNKPVEMEVFQSLQKGGKLVMDLREKRMASR
jgi:hypothetical protein